MDGLQRCMLVGAGEQRLGLGRLWGNWKAYWSSVVGSLQASRSGRQVVSGPLEPWRGCGVWTLVESGMVVYRTDGCQLKSIT